MSLTIKGNLVKILDATAGTSKAGKEWSKQEFVINTGDQYNPEVCFTLFGNEKISLLKDIAEGQELTVHFNLSSRDFQGEYYHNLDVWRIEASDLLANEPVNDIPATVEDDLPF